MSKYIFAQDRDYFAGSLSLSWIGVRKNIPGYLYNPASLLPILVSSIKIIVYLLASNPPIPLLFAKLKGSHIPRAKLEFLLAIFWLFFLGYPRE